MSWMPGSELAAARVKAELTRSDCADLLSRIIGRSRPCSASLVCEWEAGRVRVPKAISEAVRSKEFQDGIAGYSRKFRSGRAVRRPRKDGDVSYIPLADGREAIVDTSDLAILENCNWSAWRKKRADGSVRSEYVVTQKMEGQDGFVYMHRVIMADFVQPGLMVDHISGNTLDNRRANLRIVEPTGNAGNSRLSILNTSGYKGVSWSKRDEVWTARIVIRGRQVHLGTFSTAEEGAIAYARAAKQHFGECARVPNLPSFGDILPYPNPANR